MDSGLDLEEVTARAYARGVPARKWVKLVQKWCMEHERPSEEQEGLVIGSLLEYLPDPPALILNYLSTALEVGLISSRNLIIHLLFTHDSTPIPLPALTAICTILNASPVAIEPLPSALEPPAGPVPNEGPSSPPPPPEREQRWTLSLLLPFLQLCFDPQNQPIIQLVSRVLAVVAPYPAPPFDVGLQASQLMGSLPELVAIPLKESLSGLMMDLAMSDAAPPPTTNAPPQQANGAVAPPLGSADDDLKLLTPAEAFGGNLPLSIGLLVQDYRQSRSRDTSPRSLAEMADGGVWPTTGLIDLLKRCWSIYDDGDAIITRLLSAAIGQVVRGPAEFDLEHAAACMFVTEELPVLLWWWKGQTDAKIPYPETLSDAVQKAFEAHTEAINEHGYWQQVRWNILRPKEELEAELGQFSAPDGWRSTSLFDGMLRRLADLGLLTRDDLDEISPENPIRPPYLCSGESLMNRVSTAPVPYIGAIAYTTAFSPGGARSLGAEVVKTIEACPGTQPPENLSQHLASSPVLLAALTAHCPASTLLDLAAKHLIDKMEDANIRSDDPQGSMTRFGEGVVLVESLAAQFNLPLPKLLQEARVALSWSELSPEQQGMMNGWVKALFGSDGIDDETLLSTTPVDFCKLGCGLFQQAISATATGQIDLDTLHSGLSYFCQPLLSWSLGGIVTWLCREIQRQGLLSALHLDVLQNLIVSSAIPDGLLHATRSEIESIFAPHAGLASVMQSAKFDAEAIKVKLSGSGVKIELVSPLPTTTLTTLRTELLQARQLEYMQVTWPGALLSALTQARRIEGDLAALDALLSELNHPELLDLTGTWNDPIKPFVALLLLVQSSPRPRGRTTLLETLLRERLPTLLGDSGFHAPQSLVITVRLALTVLNGYDPDLAQRLMSDMVDLLVHQRDRPSPLPRETGVNESNKRKAPDSGHTAGRTLPVAARRLVDLFIKSLEDDESRTRWPAVSRL